MSLELFFYLLLLVFFLYALACLVMFLLQERFIFVPVFRTPLQPVEVATPVEEFLINTPNDGVIHSILLRSEESKGLLFYLHGNTGTLRRWQFMAEELTQYGWDVFAMDYRGFGKSVGKRSEEIMHADALAAFQFIAEEYKDKKKVVYGRSLGTGFATKLAVNKQVDGLILETPFLSLVYVANFYFPYLFNSFLLRYQFRSDKWIHQVRCPILMLQGTKDRVVPFKSARKLYQLVEDRPDADLITLVGGKHSDLNKFPLFTSSLRSFLEKIS